MNTGYNLGRKKIDVVKAILFNNDSTYFYQSLSSTNTSFGGVFLNLGLQGEFPLSSKSNTLTKDKTEYTISYGGTYTLDQKLNGKQDILRSNGTFTSSQEIPIDTALFQKNIKGIVELPSTITAGIALHKKLKSVRVQSEKIDLNVNTEVSDDDDEFEFESEISETSIEDLELQLKEALENEEYELATKIRDEINKRKK